MTIARLIEVGEALATFDSDLGQWFAVALQRCLEGEEVATAFDLAGYRAEQAARQCLLRAAEILDPGRKLSTDAISKGMALEIRRFETRLWPRVRNRNPCELRPLDRLLWQAMWQWKGMPRSARRLFDLLTVEGWHRQMKPMDTFSGPIQTKEISDERDRNCT